MEIKSNNILIGAFTLGVLVAIFGFAIWIGQLQFNKQTKIYEIVFRGSVSGLTSSGAVQYNGLPVGRVVDLHLAEDNPNMVIAMIEVDARTPVKEDSIARLEMSGITGVAVIQLSGGTPGSKLLEARNGQTYPVIPGAPSSLQELTMAAPKTLENANRLLDQLTVIVRSNEVAIANIMRSTDRLTAALADSSDDMKKTIRNLESLSRSSDAFMVDARETSRSYREVGDELNRLLRSNAPGLSQFPELVTELRSLVSSLDRFAERAQDDPARFLIGNRVPEVTAK